MCSYDYFILNENRDLAKFFGLLFNLEFAYLVT